MLRWSILMLAATLAQSMPAFAADETVVATQSGKVQGKLAAGVEAFLGIPFAASPSGAARWQPPRPVASWDGVRSAQEYGPACPQQDGIDSPRAENEDCLDLNVQRPIGTTSDAHLPVFVYIFGGGLTGGTANNEDLDAMVKMNGVIGVTMNYRLGVLGFLAHPALANAQGSAGNYGLMDQQAALRWVHDNIAAFGGDPARVTIGGESAGGRSVLAHLVAPGSRGLFARAIVQSGSDSTQTLQDAEAAGVSFAKRLGCDGPDAAACLRAKPVAALIDAQATSQQLTGGTDILPQGPYPALANGVSTVPVLIGGQRDEYRALMTIWPTRSVPEYTQEQYLAYVRSQYKDHAEDVLAVYSWPDNSTRYTGTYLVAKLRTDSAGLVAVGSCSTQKLTEAIAAHAPVWRYEFDHNDGPGWFDIPGYVWGAGHATELEYLVPNRHYRGNNGGELNLAEQQLSGEMLRAWGAFVRDGDPGVEGKVTWPRFESNGSVLSWQAGDQSHVLPLVAINTFHNCAFWDAMR